MNKGRILIVDDQEEILDSLGNPRRRRLRGNQGSGRPGTLQSCRAIPPTSYSSTSGYRASTECRPSGLSRESLRLLRHNDERARTIETAVKAIKLGATDYLEKPLNLEDVLHLTYKAVSRSSNRRQARPKQWERAALDWQFVESRWVATIFGGCGQGTGFGLVDRRQGNRQGIPGSNHPQAWRKGPEHARQGPLHRSLESNIEEVMLGRSNGSNARLGKLQQAGSGTLLLIRVDRLAEAVRSPLSKILREHSKAAGSRPGVMPRIVSTSTVDPEALTLARFPRELSDVLSQRVIRIPSLQERSEDIRYLSTIF